MDQDYKESITRIEKILDQVTGEHGSLVNSFGDVAEKQRLFVLTQNGKNVKLANFTGFKPKGL